MLLGLALVPVCDLDHHACTSSAALYSLPSTQQDVMIGKPIMHSFSGDLHQRRTMKQAMMLMCMPPMQRAASAGSDAVHASHAEGCFCRL